MYVFSGKMKKNIINLLSAEFAHTTVGVKPQPEKMYPLACTPNEDSDQPTLPQSHHSLLNNTK